MANDEELLAAYAKELELFGTLTLRGLIDSHRHLRAMNVQTEDERRKVMIDAAERARVAAREEVLIYSHERLRAMTVRELANLLSDEE